MVLRRILLVVAASLALALLSGCELVQRLQSQGMGG